MSSITINRSGKESVYASCDCGWFYHEPKDFFSGHYKALRLDTAINRHERFGCLVNPLSHIEIVGGFTILALYEPKTQKFSAFSCSCGHSYVGMDFVERCELHNMTHKNIIKIRSLYDENSVTHDGASCLLQTVCNIEEGKALDIMDTWR